MYRFYVEPELIRDGSITITGDDVNHIKNVLRMKPGEAVIICNGQGKDFHCIIKEMSDGRIIAGITDVQDTISELQGKLYLFQGLPKKDKMEWIIQKAVELGVYQIVPVMTKRTVVKIEDKKKEQRKTERWQAIAASAAKQSGRGIIPCVTEIKSMKEALLFAKELECKFIPYENAEDITYTKKLFQEIKSSQSVGIFIGPEGGFEEGEVKQAEEAGFFPITLGKRILRTETAGMAILSMLMLQMEQE